MTIPGRFMTNDKGTFGEYTASTRWPIIIQNAIDDLSKHQETEKSTALSSNKVSYQKGAQGIPIRR